MQNIVLGQFNLGGIADSEHQGITHSSADIKYLDIHSEPGIATINQAMKLEYNPGEMIIACVPCSDGKIYFFSGASGKIWKKENGVYSLWKTGSKGRIYDAKEFDGYVYYTTKTHIARWKVGTENVEESFGEFENKDDHHHPLHILNLILYAGDGNLVAQMEDTNWTSDALDLPKGMKITCFGSASTDLLIGTTTFTNSEKTQIYRWNTWSESWTISDEIPERGINSFMSVDNAILVQAGAKGNIYAYNGQSLERHKRIPGKWKEGSAEVLLNANTNLNGIPLFGLSHRNGNAILPGVFSYGSYASNYPVVLNRELMLSNGEQPEAKIGVLEIIDGILYVCHNRGIDIYDLDNKNEYAEITSRVLEVPRDKITYGGVQVAYKSLPENTNIKIYTKENWGSWRELTTTNDTKRRLVYSTVTTEYGASFQIKVRLEGHENTAPEITQIIITTK